MNTQVFEENVLHHQFSEELNFPLDKYLNQSLTTLCIETDPSITYKAGRMREAMVSRTCENISKIPALPCATMAVVLCMTGDA